MKWRGWIGSFAVSAAMASALLQAPWARANLEEKTWIFHSDPDDPSGDISLDRKGGPRGTPHFSLSEAARALDLGLTKDLKRKRFVLTHPSGRTYTLSAGAIDAPGTLGTVRLSKAPRFEKNDLLLPLDAGDRILRPLLTGVPALKRNVPSRGAVVVIDPGHGGNDWGTSVTQPAAGSAANAKPPLLLREKDLTLAISQELRAQLESAGIRTVLTRDEDLYLTLPERTRFANAAAPKLFLSIHLNSEPSKKRSGFDMYVLSLKSEEADARLSVAAENQIIPDDLSEGVEKAVADMRAESNFESSLDSAKIVGREFRKVHNSASGTGIKTGPFYVLYGAEMPALLVEVGFLSEPKEAALLARKGDREKWVAALAKALALALKRGIVRAHDD